MNFLSIRIKYSVPLFIVATALLAVLIANMFLTKNLERNAEIFPTGFMPAINVVLNADRDLYQARVAEIQYVHSAGRGANFKAEFEENAQQAKERFMQYRDYMKEYPDVIQLLRRFESAYQGWYSAASRSFSIYDSGDSKQAASHVNGESERLFSELRSLYDIAGEKAFEKANLLQEQIKATNARHKMIAWVIALVIIAVAAAVAIFSQNALRDRILEITQGIDDITSGGGDLTKHVVVKSHDEIGQLSQAFNRFVDSLCSLISNVRTDVDHLHSSSEILNQSATKTNQVAQNQSQASDMIVSAVHEMSLATKEMSNLAQNTAGETEGAMSSASEGVSVINGSVVQIQQLYKTVEGASDGAKQLSVESTNISGVLEVIRGIAEQTNLLALNAAIEAARAGEQGRGFAVVADEVRTLAQKTQESTDSIQSMIQAVQSGVTNVVEKIEDGFDKVTSSVELAKETESLLGNTLDRVTKVKDMSVQTATATEEQTAVTEDINRNLHSLNDQIQVSSEVAAETQEVANQVQTYAESIRQGVGRFKVE